MNSQISFKVGLCLAGLGAVLSCAFAADQHSGLVTQWAAQVSDRDPHSEYPRPGLVRPKWLSLNGRWDYTLRAFTGPATGSRSGTVLVPFPVESTLSGVKDAFNAQKRLEYRRKFSVPASWQGQRVLLHFDAVNWETKVELNGKLLGIHRGGYDRFSFDITDELAPDKDQDLKVSVVNPGDRGTQPRGKQSFSPRGIWYTSASGIWQTVWLEPVPAVSVAAVDLLPDVDKGTIEACVRGEGETNGVHVEAVIYDGSKEIDRASGLIGQPFRMRIMDAKLWSPENPFLYDVKLKLTRDGKTLDEVGTYFGMRKISVAKGPEGYPRIMLNNHPYFQLGVLDQGYWPDGIYTAPTDEALRSDIVLMRKLGFNMCRKHVKVEPERWYYWCDKLGLMVWQDIPSPGEFASPTDKDTVWTVLTASEFQNELERIIQQNLNHPSIAMWIAFNEGWGQHDTPQIISVIKKVDPTRVVTGASGWNDRGVGDVVSLHSYPGPAMPEFKDNRAVVCGECGGLGLEVPGHAWLNLSPWSYTRLNSRTELAESFSALLSRIGHAREVGLSGAVITQLTDVESEVNGLVTYDRQVKKLDSITGKVQAWNK